MVKAIIFDFFGVLAAEGTPNAELLSYLHSELKSKYKLGIISNAASDWVNGVLAEDDVKLFDDITVSYKAGMAKPNPEIYSIALKQLGVKAAEIVFIDDIEAYCEAARKLGMHAVHYQDFSQMKNELEVALNQSA